MAVLNETQDAAANSGTSYSLTIGDSLTGQISSASDVDWVKLSLTAGKAYHFTLTGTTLQDPVLQLYNSAQSKIAEDDDINWPTDPDADLIFVAPASGTYYLAASSFQNLSTGSYSLKTVALTPNFGSSSDFADQLATDYWANLSQSPRSFDPAPGNVLYVRMNDLSPISQHLARAALAEWSHISGLTFSEGSPPAGHGVDITFRETAGSLGTSLSVSGSTINSAVVSISTDYLASFGSHIGSFSFLLYMYQVGRALGLGNAGDYDRSAVFGTDTTFDNDSWLTSVMSLISPNENPFVADTSFFPATPRPADAAAIGRLYQVSSHPLAGNSTYGFNGNVAGALADLAVGEAVGLFTLFDPGGADHINFASRSENLILDLRPEATSFLKGGDAQITLAAGTIIENATGGSGNDIIYGNTSANVLYGKSGQDRILPGLGADTVYGGGWKDTLDLSGSPAAQTVNLQTNVNSGGFAAGDRYFNIEVVIGADNYNDHITGNIRDNILYGGGGIDTLRGRGGNDTLYGGDDQDHLVGGKGEDLLFGGKGRDFASYKDAPWRIHTNLKKEGTFGHANGDQYDDIQNIRGSGHNDRIFGNGKKNKIFAQAGDDFIEGRSGRDGIRGGGGDDSINGGQGDDRLFGGFGDDIFIFRQGHDNDTIFDFDMRGNDRIDLTDFGYSSFAQVQGLLSSVTGGVLLSFDANNSVFFDGVAMSVFDTTDFIL